MAEEDYADIEAMRGKVEQAKLDLAKAEEREKQAGEREAEIIKEIQAEGVAPDNIAAEITQLEGKLKEEADVIRAQFDGVDKALETDEAVVANSTMGLVENEAQPAGDALDNIPDIGPMD